MGSGGAPAGLANQRAVRRHNLGVVLRHVSEHGPRSRATIALETGSEQDHGLEPGHRADRARPARRARARAARHGRPARPGRGAVRRRRRRARARDQRRLPRGARARPHGRRAPPQPRRARQPPRAGREGARPARRARDHRARVRARRRAAPGRRDGGAARARGRRERRAAGGAEPRLDGRRAWSTSCASGSSGPPFPLAADNEANLAAMAELWEGTARGLSDVLYVSGEIGVGAGIIVGGELFRGSQGFGGEFGHMTLDPDGRPCACGSRGCLETLAGLEALLEMAGLDASGAATTAGSGEPVAVLAGRARAGDEKALAALREGGRWLGIGIASAANLLNFQAVVLGGFFAQLATVAGLPDRARARDARAGVGLGGAAPAAVHARPGGGGARRGRGVAAARARRPGLGGRRRRGVGSRAVRRALALMAVLAVLPAAPALAAPETSPGRAARHEHPRARRDLRARGRAAPVRLLADRRVGVRHLRARARPCGSGGSTCRTRRTRTSTSARASCSCPTTRSAGAGSCT